MKKFLSLLLPSLALTGCIIRQPATEFGYTYDYSSPLIQSPASQVYTPSSGSTAVVYEKIPEALPIPATYSTIPDPLPRPSAIRSTAVATPQQPVIVRESAGATQEPRIQATETTFPVQQTPAAVVVNPGVSGFVTDLSTLDGTGQILADQITTDQVISANEDVAFTNQPPFSPSSTNTDLVVQPTAGAFSTFTNNGTGTVTNDLATNSQSFGLSGTITNEAAGAENTNRNFATNSQPFRGTNSSISTNRSFPSTASRNGFSFTNEAAGAENTRRNFATNSQPFRGTNTGITTNQIPPTATIPRTNGVFQIQRSQTPGSNQVFVFTNPPGQAIRPEILESSGAQVTNAPGTPTPAQPGFPQNGLQPANPVNGQSPVTPAAPPAPRPMRAPTGQPNGGAAPR